MSSRIPFTFGIPLMPRASARDWSLIGALLELTLSSVLAQTDQDFRVIVAGHDCPDILSSDTRIRFLKADWPVEAIRSDNLDRGRKTQAINDFVLQSGGGLLMFLDADDWVDVTLVEAARSLVGPYDVVALIESGFATDFQSLRAAVLPDRRVFAGEFHRICGSSAVLQLRAGDSDGLRRDPYQALHEHYRLMEVAEIHGTEPLHLPVLGSYTINTSENHSEAHGPYAEWRRDFVEAVNRFGAPIDAAFAARFGLKLEHIRQQRSRTAACEP
jgi:hypothetical protein